MASSSFYDIELIDVDPTVDNFAFGRVSSKDLESILESFQENTPFLKFSSEDSSVLLERKYFRGVMHVAHEEKKKTIAQENIEDSEEIGKIEIVKNKNKPKVVSKEK